MSNIYLNFFILKMFYYCNYNNKSKDNIFELKTLPIKPFDKFIYNYVNRINLSNNTILLSLCIFEKNKNKLNINENSIYLISLFLLRLADKFHEDDHIFNDLWAKELKMDLSDFNYLEYKLLSKLDFNVYVSNNEFKIMERNLLSI
jgi:hypothetical protein